MKPRTKPPNVRSDRRSDQPYHVWASQPTTIEDKFPWKNVASFYYFQEALDYVQYCNVRGSGVYLQSPVEVKHYPPSDNAIKQLMSDRVGTIKEEAIESAS